MHAQYSRVMMVAPTREQFFSRGRARLWSLERIEQVLVADGTVALHRVGHTDMVVLELHRVARATPAAGTGATSVRGGGRRHMSALVCVHACNLARRTHARTRALPSPSLQLRHTHATRILWQPRTCRSGKSCRGHRHGKFHTAHNGTAACSDRRHRGCTRCKNTHRSSIRTPHTQRWAAARCRTRGTRRSPRGVDSIHAAAPDPAPHRASARHGRSGTKTAHRNTERAVYNRGDNAGNL